MLPLDPAVLEKRLAVLASIKITAIPSAVRSRGRVASSLLARVLLLNATTAPRRLRVLTTDTDPPVVAETTVETDLLHPFEVLTHLGVEQVRVLLGRLPVHRVPLPVEHPCWDAVLDRVRDHGNDLVHLISCELPCTLVHVNVALLAHQVREATSKSADGGDGEHRLLASIHVRVTETQDMLEVLSLELHRHGWQWVFLFFSENARHQKKLQYL